MTIMIVIFLLQVVIPIKLYNDSFFLNNPIITTVTSPTTSAVATATNSPTVYI